MLHSLVYGATDGLVGMATWRVSGLPFFVALRRHHLLASQVGVMDASMLAVINLPYLFLLLAFCVPSAASPNAAACWFCRHGNSRFSQNRTWTGTAKQTQHPSLKSRPWYGCQAGRQPRKSIQRGREAQFSLQAGPAVLARFNMCGTRSCIVTSYTARSQSMSGS